MCAAPAARHGGTRLVSGAVRLNIRPTQLATHIASSIVAFGVAQELKAGPTSKHAESRMRRGLSAHVCGVDARAGGGLRGDMGSAGVCRWKWWWDRGAARPEAGRRGHMSPPIASS